MHENFASELTSQTALHQSGLEAAAKAALGHDHLLEVMMDLDEFKQMFARSLEAYLSETGQRRTPSPQSQTHVNGERKFCDFPNCDCSSGAAERCSHPPATNLRALLDKALTVLDTYADPTGYTDRYGEVLSADAEVHEGLLARDIAKEIRAELSTPPPQTREVGS